LDANAKNTIRKYYKDVRENVADKEKLSTIVCAYIKSFDIYANSSCPVLYWAQKNEVSLLEICQERWLKKQKFGLPRCLDKNGNMDVFEARKDMSYDCRNIPSPLPESVISPQNIECIFIPAVAFDNFGRRIGQGGGYYDRFLLKCVNAVKIGVCFSAQISQNPLPENGNDVRVSIIVSEKGVIRI